MKVIVSSTGPTIDAEVDPRFGRATYLLLVESDTGELLEVIDNSRGKNVDQGAGIAAAALVAEKGAKKIFTGVVGPKAMKVIEKAGIEVVSNVSGTVSEAVTSLQAGKKQRKDEKQSDSSQAFSRTKSSGSKSGCRRLGGSGKGMGRGQGGQGGGRS